MMSTFVSCLRLELGVSLPVVLKGLYLPTFNCTSISISVLWVPTFTLPLPLLVSFCPPFLSTGTYMVRATFSMSKF